MSKNHKGIPFNDVIIPRHLLDKMSPMVSYILSTYGPPNTIHTLRISTAKDLMTMQFIDLSGQLIWQCSFYPPPTYPPPTE